MAGILHFCNNILRKSRSMPKYACNTLESKDLYKNMPVTLWKVKIYKQNMPVTTSIVLTERIYRKTIVHLNIIE